MKASANRWLVWAGLIALFLGIRFATTYSLVSGEPPPLAGQTVAGPAFELSSLRGKPALVYFWASWCPICRGMQSSVKSVAQDHPFISVALQSGNREELTKYLREQDFPVPTLPDEDGAISSRYGLRGVPAVFVLGPDGTIRYATTGYTSEIGMRVRLWLAGLVD